MKVERNIFVNIIGGIKIKLKSGQVIGQPILSIDQVLTKGEDKEGNYQEDLNDSISGFPYYNICNMYIHDNYLV